MVQRGRSQSPPRAVHGQGFERPPRGCLIHQLIELQSPMGVAYERSVEFYKSPHVHDRGILIFPRGGSSMDVTMTRSGEVHRLTGADGLFVPAGVAHDDRGVSNVYNTFALLPSDALWRPTRARRTGPPASTCAFRRSTWLEALLDEYFIDRVLERPRVSPRRAHLEALILLEVSEAIACLSRDARKGAVERIPGPSSLVGRATRFLEANLFAPLDLEKVARATGASRSSLLRHFRAQTGVTPAAYIRARRLDEAEWLLGRGDHNVSDVARLVGYTSVAAFSGAFRARFGIPPSGRRA